MRQEKRNLQSAGGTRVCLLFVHEKKACLMEAIMDSSFFTLQYDY